jgi:hypothetical protein
MYEAVKQNYEVALNYINPADYMFGEGGFYWNEK